MKVEDGHMPKDKQPELRIPPGFTISIGDTEFCLNDGDEDLILILDGNKLAKQLEDGTCEHVTIERTVDGTD